MATDPKTGNIINDDHSWETIRAHRAAELSNPGDEGPKVPKDLASVELRQQPLSGSPTTVSTPETSKQTDSQKSQQEGLDEFTGQSEEERRQEYEERQQQIDEELKAKQEDENA